jgi:iron complex transport system substrate-binding protein
MGGNPMSTRFGLFASSMVAAALTLLGTPSCMPARAADLPRIVSMNVCTDQLVVTLADPEQIIGLSRFSRDASWAADNSSFPFLSGGAEDVLVLKPDIVVASLFDKRSTRELLKEHGIRVAEFAVPQNLDQARIQIRAMGEIVGHQGRAAQEIAKLDAALARAHQAVAAKHYSVLPLSRRGWVAGSDTFVSALLTETGLFNAAGDLGFGMSGFASLEAIVNVKPDFLLVSQAGDHAGDDGQAFLLHPALERFYPPNKRIVIPERLTECGGVLLAQALDVLVKELERVER